MNQYELLLGKNCLDNAYVPPYYLPEDKFAAIREAAYKAVADCCGQYHAD